MVEGIIELLNKVPLGKTILGLPDRVQKLESQVKELEKKLSTPLGDRCEYCGEPQMFLDREERGAGGLPIFAVKRVFKCHACGKEITRVTT